MRILKFAIYLGLLGGAGALGWPRWSAQATLLCHARAYLPEVPAWSFWLPLGLVLLATSALFGLALVLRWRLGLVPHAVVLALFAAALLGRVWEASAGGPGEVEPPPGVRMSQAAARLQAGLLAEARSQAAPRPVYPEEAAALERWLQVDGRTLRSGFRRHGWPAEVRLRVLPRAEGPVLQPLPGDPAGTLYYAVSPDRGRYWITLVGLSRHPTGAPSVMLAEDGRPLVLEPGGGPP
jgi:hypothetical protein